VSTVSQFLSAARTQLLTATGAILSEETIYTIRTSGRSPRHLEFAVGRASETPLQGSQKPADGMPVRYPVDVVAAYQLLPKDRAVSMDSAEDFAASLRAKMLAGTWLSTPGAIVLYQGMTIDSGIDGWVWFTLTFSVSQTLTIS
jgi:hypothetical protein